MKAPSTTITWAGFAGAVATATWELVDMLTSLEPTPALVGSTVTIAAFVAGKLVKEKRYLMVER